MDNILKTKVSCPTCKKGLLTYDDNNIYCNECSKTYQIIDGVFDLINNSQQKRSLAQRAMEFKPLIRIYETRLWRKSPLFSIFTGISFKDEFETIIKAAALKGNETLLDLACGPGIYSRPFAKKLENSYAVGLDLSIPMLKYASFMKQREGIDNLMLFHGDALDLPFLKNEFDIVNVLEVGYAQHPFRGHEKEKVMRAKVEERRYKGVEISEPYLLMYSLYPLSDRAADLPLDHYRANFDGSLDGHYTKTFIKE